MHFGPLQRDLQSFSVFRQIDPRYAVGADDPAKQDAMTSFAPVSGLVGGALIGLAAVVLMLTIGRIAGVCGIALNAMTASDAAGRSWRLAFILGLPLGALLVTCLLYTS